MAKAKRGENEPTVIKKYANRRLYDTGRSSYVTLEDLCEMVKEGHDFVVYDAKSNEDITRNVLTQIIVDQESRGQNLLPTGFLRKLIGFYGDNVQGLVPNYLESTMDMFITNQERFREQINKSLEGMTNMKGMFPPSMNKVPGMGSMPNMGSIPGMPASIEEMSRKNMEMFEQTMKMFTPFGVAGSEGSSSTSKEEQVKSLKENIKKMEEELNRLS